MLCQNDKEEYEYCGFPNHPEFPFQFIYWIEVYSGQNSNNIHRWTYYYTAGDSIAECDEYAKSVPLHANEKASRVFRCSHEDARKFMEQYNGRIFTRSHPKGGVEI